jgi:branched-subunit amino acid aminotransferase/4-amino-4-deoxychorismate lyase
MTAAKPPAPTGSAVSATPDFSAGAAFNHGRFVPIAQASIPMTDWGFLRSDACYDVARVWDGAFFRLGDHLERFFASCRRFRLDPGLDAAQVTEVLTQCVRLSALRASYVEMICTRGQPPWGSRDPRQAANRFHAFAVPFVWIANAEQRERGLHVLVHREVQRIAALPVALLARADEIFLTSSGGGFLPVTRLDGRAVGSGRPGPTTLAMLEAYWAWHRRPEHRLEVRY